jgi:drug/metabolite transporter (DMT)-like permease
VERARRNATIVLGGLLALLGVAMIVRAIGEGGGPMTIGILVGAAFAVLGCARVYLAVGPRTQRRL